MTWHVVSLCKGSDMVGQGEYDSLIPTKAFIVSTSSGLVSNFATSWFRRRSAQNPVAVLHGRGMHAGVS
jgi:hypothetical protein